MVEKVQFLYTALHNLIIFISLLYGIIYWGKIKQHEYLKLFPVYIAASLLVSVPWFFKNFNFPGVLFQNIFVPFEFYIFYYFFIKILQSKTSHFILTSLTILFSLLMIIIPALLYLNQSKYTGIEFFNHTVFTEILVIANILIVIPILLYYRSLFNRPYIKNVTADPVFLVMTGILFCVAFTIPVYAFQKVILRHNISLYLYLYIINSIAYIVMHLFFIKAFKNIQ